MSKLSSSVPRLSGKKQGNMSFSAPAEAMSNSDLISALGSSKSMPAPVQAKMEGSFGMSLSDVSLYESPLVSQNGAEAAASGNKIAFAPGKLDLSSSHGQELLGHELSHVAAQKRGEVSGSGFLNDSGLEHRADREGALAAKGSSVFDSETGGTLSPMSGGASLASGPMQAKKPDVEYAPSASEQLDDRVNNLVREDGMIGQNLSEIALQRQLMQQQEQPQQFDPEYEAAYQKKITSLSQKDLEKILQQHSRHSNFAYDQLNSNKEFYYYDSLGNANMNEEQADLYSKGMVNYNAKASGTGYDFMGFEQLLQDIQSNVGSKSAKALSTLTGEGGQYEHMEGVENMRNLLNMSDNEIDSAKQMRTFSSRMAPIGEKRQAMDASKLSSLSNTQEHFGRNKTRPWWQFWK